MARKIKASFTIEAVFVMPIVLFTMVSIIYLSFYLYDHCKIQGITDLVLHKAVLNLKHEADISTGRVNYAEINKGLLSSMFEKADAKEKDIEDYLSKQLSKGLIITRITDVQVTKGVLNISVRVKGTFKIPLRGVQQIISSNGKQVIESKSIYHYPADSVRMSEVILDTSAKIKGFDNIKDKIGRLITN